MLQSKNHKTEVRKRKFVVPHIIISRYINVRNDEINQNLFVTPNKSHRNKRRPLLLINTAKVFLIFFNKSVSFDDWQ